MLGMRRFPLRCPARAAGGASDAGGVSTVAGASPSARARRRLPQWAAAGARIVVMDYDGQAHIRIRLRIQKGDWGKYRDGSRKWTRIFAYHSICENYGELTKTHSAGRAIGSAADCAASPVV